jgi:GT2 family glycosyltransferase
MININNITVLIVLYEEPENIIFRTLEQIKNFKIIIVDNKGNQKLKKKITTNYNISIYLLNEKNLGFSKGFNQAIRLCKTEFTFIKNADCFIDEKNIIKLLDYIKKNDDCGIVAPTSYDEFGNLTYNSGRLPENEFSNQAINLEGNICVEKVLGASILARTNDLKNIGMFNEELFIYFSDDDLCKKIKNSGKSIVQVYNSKSVHTHGISKVNNKFKKIFLREYNFTHDELMYYKDISDVKFNKTKSKLVNYILKIIINLIKLNISNVITYVARLYALKKFINKYK